MHVGRRVLQPELHRRQVRRAQRDMLDSRQPVHEREPVLFGLLRRQRHLPGIVLLRPGRRLVRDGGQLLQRPVHDRHGADPGHMRHVAAGGTRQLRDGGRRPLRRLRGRRRCGVHRRRAALVRRRMLQPCVRALRAHGRSRLPAGDRVPRRGRRVLAGRRLLRVGRAARGIGQAGHVCHHGARYARGLPQPAGLQAERRRVQAGDHVMQLVVRLLRWQLRERGHLPPGQPGRAAVCSRDVRRSGRRVLVGR